MVFRHLVHAAELQFREDPQNNAHFRVGKGSPAFFRQPEQTADGKTAVPQSGLPPQGLVNNGNVAAVRQNVFFRAERGPVLNFAVACLLGFQPFALRVGNARLAHQHLKRIDAVEPDLYQRRAEVRPVDHARVGQPVPVAPAVVVMPTEGNDAPIVVMVHGSGALDRDETVYNNKPFSDIAKVLAKEGIASLRYDKRTFVYRQPVTSMDDETILDALSAISLASKYGKRVYLLGHSLGALLAPIIAKRAKGQLEGIIMMAAPARDLEEVVREQFDYLLPSGASDGYKNQQIENLRQRAPHYLQPQGQLAVAQQLNTPMLILQGERDYQVSMKDFHLWQQALQGHDNVVFHSYPTLNHLFMEGEGKSTPLEYQIQGHVAESALKDIADFINCYDRNNEQ